MRIFYSHDQDAMLLDTGEKLNVLHDRLSAFLASAMVADSIPAETTHSPAPYHEFLNGLRVQKSQGHVNLCLSQDRWLELTGSETNLAKYVSHFHFKKPEENDHHHPDNADYMARGSMRLIIEADSTWAEQIAG